MLSLGLGLLLSALSVHFRDIRDLLGSLLTLWFFATPIIYPYTQAPERFRPTARPQSLHAPGRRLPGSAVRGRTVPRRSRLGLAAGLAVVALIVGYAVFDRLRETFAEEV